jgi:hypothetical protein
VTHLGLLQRGALDLKAVSSGWSGCGHALHGDNAYRNWCKIWCKLAVSEAVALSGCRVAGSVRPLQLQPHASMPAAVVQGVPFIVQHVVLPTPQGAVTALQAPIEVIV